MSKSESVHGWHFIPADGEMSKYDNTRRVKITEGKTYSVKPPIVLCGHGLHASERVLDALQYARTPLLCRVVLSGEIVQGSDKMCATRRKVIAIRDISTLLHVFACDVAEEALTAAKVERTPDSASWGAIEAKRRWLRGEITDVALDAAMNAAWAAAMYATMGAARGAAGYAARGAAGYAAMGAAMGAARGAAMNTAWNAARGAAMGATWNRFGDLLEARVRAEFGIADDATPSEEGQSNG